LQDGAYRLFARDVEKGTQFWQKPPAIQVRAMVLAEGVLFVAGPPAESHGAVAEVDQGQGALLVAISASDGAEMAKYRLDSPPVFDGMAAANGRLYLSLTNGRVLCMEGDG
jgi:hypothetical protein